MIMLNLIVVLVTSSALVYISGFNSMPVSVNFGSFVVANVPLFYVIIGSILFGIVLSYLFHLISSVSTALALRSKDNELKKEKQEVLELTKRVHQLELENEKQKNPDTVIIPTDPNAL